MLTVLTPPESEPLTLAEAKTWCRIWADVDEEDALLTGLIQAAREYVEARTARALLTQTLLETRTVRPDGTVRLLRAPAREIESVAGDEGDITSTSLLLCHEPPVVGGLPPGSEVTITYTAGFTGEALPERAKYAVAFLVAAWYANREAIQQNALNPVPFTVDALCQGLSWGGEVCRD